MSNPIKTYDMTIKSHSEEKEEEIEKEREILDKFFTKMCDKWCYQLEKGEGGYLHYQCRMSLKERKRKTQVINILEEYDIGAHVRPTSSGCTRNMFYVLKEDTRIAGPWADIETMEEEGLYIPRQIREIKELRPFQQDIIDKSKEWDKRTINIVVDEGDGNNGKSTLKTYMRCHKMATVLPYCNDFRDIMRMVYCLPTSTCYIIDMPRALTKKHLEQFFAAIEEIKNGYAYDERYTFKDKVFDCPNIWVFTNRCPETTLLSPDRWKVWRISSKYKLKQIEMKKIRKAELERFEQERKERSEQIKYNETVKNSQE